MRQQELQCLEFPLRRFCTRYQVGQAFATDPAEVTDCRDGVPDWYIASSNSTVRVCVGMTTQSLPNAGQLVTSQHCRLPVVLVYPAASHPVPCLDTRCVARQ